MLLCLFQVWHHWVKLMTGSRITKSSQLFSRQVPPRGPGAVSLLSQGGGPKILKGIWKPENEIVSRWHTFHHAENTHRKSSFRLHMEMHPFLRISQWRFLKKDAGRETTVLHFNFSIRKRGNVCCQGESIHNMFVRHTTEGEREHLAIASVRLRRHLFTSRLCDTDGFELKIHSMLYLRPHLCCWIQLLEWEITVLNLSHFLPMISGNVDIIPRPWCFCPLGHYKHEAALPEPFQLCFVKN